MSLSARLVLINILLIAGFAAQWGLTMHLDHGVELIYPELRKPLADVPLGFPTDGKTVANECQGWIGKTNPHEELIRKQLPFAPDGLVSRTYVSCTAPISLNLYMVHSKRGEDRKHHPEICIRDVTGAPEDLSARKILHLNGDEERPIQRFRFHTGGTEDTTVYYWHLTFPRIPREGETNLQVLYQTVSKPPPSITVQVTTLAKMDELAAIEKTFLTELDRALRARHLPEGTLMRCDRLPIALIRQ
jgi:hypothetical protein